MKAPIEKDITPSKPLSTLPSVATAAANAILTGKALPKEATTAGYAAAQAAEVPQGGGSGGKTITDTKDNGD